ncbi:hypothetical protein BJ508DRAFT_315058 [Ascobolus immersus RN42]|uniref:Uncharacterized protein n=1 Tax=Ascobolus immersus RN42 TaxID=1160509 RepID=A0A3N4HG17_ASCIM|nr:hypothetical protein BJ508DRAFT_315058 [Ascobolus immersus RN42]
MAPSGSGTSGTGTGKRRKTSSTVNRHSRVTVARIPNLYVGLRKECEDHMPLTEAEIEDLYFPSDDSTMPTEQEYERLEFSSSEYVAAMSQLTGRLTPESSATPSPRIPTQGLAAGSTTAGAPSTTTPSRPEGGASLAALDILNGNTGSSDQQTQSAEDHARQHKQQEAVESMLKRKRLEMFLIGEVITTTLYLRLKIYCKNRMFYRFEWSAIFRRAIIRDCFGKTPTFPLEVIQLLVICIDVDHTIWSPCFTITGSIRTSWQTKILNAAHRLIVAWIPTPEGQKWCKSVFGKTQHIMVPGRDTPLARIPPVSEFQEKLHTIETARRIFRVIEDGTDWTALVSRKGKLNHAGTFIVNKALMCLQVEACNCIPWLSMDAPKKDKRTGKQEEPTIIYKRPLNLDGSEMPQNRSTTVLNHLKLMDVAATGLVPCPLEAELRERMEANNEEVPPGTPHRMLGLLPPMPKTLHGGRTKTGTYDDISPNLIPNMISTGMWDGSDDEDEDDETDDEALLAHLRGENGQPNGDA